MNVNIILVCVISEKKLLWVYKNYEEQIIIFLVRHSVLNKSNLFCFFNFQGDSGGPLQVIHPNTPQTKCMYDIIGITSFGVVGCGLDKNLPGVYTRVSNYLEWIENTVWPR